MKTTVCVRVRIEPLAHNQVTDPLASGALPIHGEGAQ